MYQYDLILDSDSNAVDVFSLDKFLEKTLEDREYLCSNRLTIADICVSYAIHLAGSLGIDQAFKPNIKRWTDMLFEREGYKKSLSYKYEE